MIFLRNHDEFRDELLRRKSEFDTRRHRRNRILTQGTCAVLCLCLVIGFLLPGVPVPIAPTEPLISNTDPSSTPSIPPVTHPGNTQTLNLLSGFIPADTKGQPLDDAFTAAQMNFALELLRGCYNGENTLVSPLSATLALSMTASGAGGNTLAQMEDVLCGGMDIADWNAYLKYYVNSLPTSKDAKLAIANSIWYDSNAGLMVKPAFLQTVADHYDADIFAAPFGHGTVNEINNWVSNNTDGLIQNPLDRVDDIMYLINALVFDGKWAVPYSSNDLKAFSFTTEDGTVQDALAMFSTEHWFLQSESATGFMKDYAGGDYRFVAILPDREITLSEYVKALTPEELTSMLKNAQQTDIGAYLPQFECGNKLSLVEILMDMGITDVFNSMQADLSPMATSDDGRTLFVDEVIHQTFIRVDANGTKAAATTIIGVDRAMAMGREIILDRPFLYMIVDTHTNLPIFIGTVTDLG